MIWTDEFGLTMEKLGKNCDVGWFAILIFFAIYFAIPALFLCALFGGL